MGSVIRGIMKSRNAFESSPDTGFFGKSVSRICNLIECYIFRLIFIGIFLNLICMPIAVIVISSLSLVLSITSFIWMPFVLWLYSLF